MKNISDDFGLEIGEIVRFNKIKKNRISGQKTWLDVDENHIPPGTIGLIVSKRWVADEEDECWEYDISIPELGIITCGWSDYAFTVISTKKA